MGGSIRPQVGKVEAIAAAPLPNTKRRLRSFLGLVGWYRRLIPNFSSRSAVLTDMTRKASPVKVKWTQESENAFNELKNCLCQEPVVQCPDFNLPFNDRQTRPEWVSELFYCKERMGTSFLWSTSAENSFQPYRFQVQYRPGHKNIIADFLSRDSEE